MDRPSKNALILFCINEVDESNATSATFSVMNDLHLFSEIMQPLIWDICHNNGTVDYEASTIIIDYKL